MCKTYLKDLYIFIFLCLENRVKYFPRYVPLPVILCLCFLWNLHLYLCHLCPHLFCFGLFCAVIQFESTRSSSPTECCRFSPWSRKVVVPPPPSCLHQLLPTPRFCNHSLVFLCLTPPDLHNQPLVKRMPTSCSVSSVLPSVCCETGSKPRFPPRWHVRMRALRRLPWVCTMPGMCVCLSHSGSL